MKKQVLILAFIILLINSCKTDDLELSNGSAISTATFPTNLAELKGGINATYSPLQSQGLYGRYLFFMYDYMGDDVQTNRGSADLLEFKNYTFTPTNNDIYLYWKNCYNGISRANFILDKQDNIAAIEESVISQQLKDKFIGEAKFLRAYYYFLLVSRFGDIPLYTTTDVSPNGLPKSSKEDVYQLIISDLTDAASKLYLKSTEEAGRATKGSAYALLGKVHLYRGEFTQAKIAFDEVINSGEYSLTSDYFDNFNRDTENNSESVFEVQFVYDNGNAWAYADWGGQDNGYSETTFRSAEYGAIGGWHNNDPSEELVAEYEAGDPRMHANFYFEGDAHATGIVTQAQIGIGVTAAWRKYQLSYSTYSDLPGLSDINMRTIRYADVLLMAAEAENEIGGDPVGKLNMVRTRVGMPLYGTAEMNATFPVTTQSEIFTAIIHERRVELAGEQTRFPDLMRWGMMNLIPNFQTGKHEFLPIPQKEIDTNLNLSNADQNPGY